MRERIITLAVLALAIEWIVAFFLWSDAIATALLWIVGLGVALLWIGVVAIFALVVIVAPILFVFSFAERFLVDRRRKAL